MLDPAPYIDVSRCVGLGQLQAPSALAGLMMLEDLEVDILWVLESAYACLPGVSVSLSSHLGAQTWGSTRPGLAAEQSWPGSIAFQSGRWKMWPTSLLFITGSHITTERPGLSRGRLALSGHGIRLACWCEGRPKYRGAVLHIAQQQHH